MTDEELIERLLSNGLDECDAAVDRITTLTEQLAAARRDAKEAREDMTNLEQFARDELTRAGLFDKDSDYGGMLGHAIIRMIRVFAEEGHSGFSAGMAVSAFSKLARFEPLTPLTGEDDEWCEVGDGVFQNIRCSRVFKDKTGVYDIQGRVFREPSGACFTSSESRVPVEFPYTPKTEYVDVETDQ